MNQGEFLRKLEQMADAYQIVGYMYCKKIPISEEAKEKLRCLKEELAKAYSTLYTDNTELQKSAEHFKSMVHELQNNPVFIDTIAFYEGQQERIFEELRDVRDRIDMLIYTEDISE